MDGNCKLQWKVDWAMRWFTFDVDFEMYGKDLTESAILSNKICKTLGKNPPNGFAYELFLDEKGEKISKSKGNGISIEQWLRYASPESLSLYMYPNPKRAKKLYAEVVPKTVDEYLTSIEKYSSQKDKDQILNPVWHVHNGKPPSEKIVMPDIILIPLLCFDLNGTRLGMGQGIYDRSLPFFELSDKYGLAFSAQETNELITEQHDFLIDGVITEKNFLSFKRKKN